MPGAESLVRVYILPGLHRAQHAAPLRKQTCVSGWAGVTRLPPCRI